MAGSFESIESMFDSFDVDHDFLDDSFIEQNELADCYLTDEALVEFLTPPQESWRDFLPEKNEAVITMNHSKEVQWKLAKEEIEHVRKRVMELVGADEFKDVNESTLVLFCLGPETKMGIFLREELELSAIEYMEFIATLCTQASYRVSSKQLFCKDSLLKGALLISEETYNGIWKRIAEKRKLKPGEMSTNRREQPLWASLELIVNELLKNVSVVKREGQCSLSLDDDKIWMNLSKAASDDLFGLSYTRHVRPNRFGELLHTCASTGAIIPQSVAFERENDTTLECFKRILDFLFKQDGRTNLRNVSVHSDRGYMIPTLVFEYLLKSGAEVVGTVKRMAQCWPFTYKQKLKADDGRTLLETKGAPTLFLKWCKSGTKHIFASAFRNGSDKIATAISTMHTQHHWEGIVQNEDDLVKYKKNESLASLFFQRCSKLSDEDEGVESTAEKEAMKWLLENEIEPCTLKQGEFIMFRFSYSSFEIQ